MDIEKMQELSKPYVQRLTANIGAVRDTCEMLKEVIDEIDWHLSFRATTCVILIEELLGVEIECEDFLDFVDEHANKQLKNKPGDIDDV